MGKKIDLNTPRTSSFGAKSRRTSHSFSHSLPSSQRNTTNPNELENQNSEQTTNNSPSKIQKKGTEMGLRAAGIPKGIAKSLSKNNRTYELADKVKAVVEFPKKVKLTFLILSIALPLLLLLMLFVTLFQDDDMNNNGIFVYGKNCPTVTVINTDCDYNAKNCKHTYDGEVEFEDYIAGVVAAEVEDGNNSEFYKVAAIIARNYFLNNVGDDCEIEGNAKKQAYKDVEFSPYSEKIKQAVEETRGLVLVKDDELATTFYASACVVDADDSYYYVRYGRYTLGNVNYQKIPKNWGGYPGVSLSYWYSLTNLSDTNYDTKSCPNNHDYGMTQIGAYYLTTEENYEYQDIIEYYFGDVEIMSVYKTAAGADGFINPTDTIYCSSPYGMRLHPVYFEWRMHTGIDIGVYSNIYAAKSGTVVYLVDGQKNSDNSGYGNVIKIEHDDGDATLYAHIAPNTIPSSVYYGARVEQGDIIGYTGTTGTSTGVHLHYEVFKNGNRVDPADYLDLTNATGGACKK